MFSTKFTFSLFSTLVLRVLNVKVVGFLILILSQTLMINLSAQPLAAGRSKYVGNIIANGNSIRPNFVNYWNQVTAENAGKWGSVQFGVGTYNWTQLDNIYNFAKSKGFLYRHHVLIWGQQQPTFLNSLDSAQQYTEIENWIKETGKRYPNADYCEVVNEPLHAKPSYKNALGGDGVTGWDWVIKAFELARKHWPAKTKLLINEYSIINDNNANANYLKIINLLKDRGLIDGIGVQGHNFEVNGGASMATLTTNLNNLAATGLPIHITEFDINVADDNTQLQRYQTIFPTLYEHPGVYGITLWGYIEYEIWQGNAYLLTERFAERPAMQWLRTYLQSPFAPALVSPVDVINMPVKVTLKWKKSESATSYKIQVSQSNSFATTVIDTTVTDTVLITKTLKDDAVFYWRVSASNDKGTSPYSKVAYFVTEKLTSVNDKNEIIPSFKLAQNYPNPFNPVTRIQYFIPKESYVSLKVYDLLGEVVATLFEGNKNQGVYEVDFDGSNMPSGVYIYQLRSGSFVETKKLILLK